MTTEPAISVIMHVADDFETNREAIRHLAAQTIAARIELVLVVPSREAVELDEAALAPFHGHRVVEAGPIRVTAHATACGIRAAGAAYVAYAEEHSYMGPRLIECVLDALRSGYVAVGWGLENANPSLVSWAHAYLQFAPLVAPVASGEVEALVGHHCAYRRSALLAYGETLEDAMCTEGVLHAHLRAKGERLYRVGEATSAHVQISALRHLVGHEFTMQRVFACTRVEIMGWGWGRRLLYAAGAPLIPFVRVRRSLAALARAPAARRRALVPRVVPVMLAAAAAGALGEMLGYLVGGKQRALERGMPYELDRYAFVAAGERRRARAVSEAHGAGRGRA